MQNRTRKPRRARRHIGIAAVLIVFADFAFGAAATFQVESVHSLPSFSISPAKPTRTVNLFLSPTCNFCENLLLDTIEAYRSQRSEFNNVRTTFTLMPRDPYDVQVISGLLCIDGKHRAKSIADYYRAIRKINGNGAISRATAERAYAATMAKYGVSAERQARCESDGTHRAVVGEIYRLGDTLRVQDKMPVVVYNDSTLDLHRFTDLAKAMR